MLLLGDIHKCICLKFFADDIGPSTVIVNNLAKEQFNWANAMWTLCGCHVCGICGGSYAVPTMCTCVVQLRLQIFYLLLKLLVFDSSGGDHIILVLHMYVGQLSLYVVDFVYKFSLSISFAIKRSLLSTRRYADNLTFSLHLRASALYVATSLKAFSWVASLYAMACDKNFSQCSPLLSLLMTFLNLWRDVT